MDGELVNGSPSDGEGGDGKNRPLDIRKLLDEQCPIYMSYGMSYCEYWDGDNEAPRYYRELARLRVKERDYQAWLTASYVYSALTRIYPLFNPFATNRPEPFLDKPFSYMEESTSEDAGQEEEKRQMEAWKEYMLSQMGGESGEGS